MCRALSARILLASPTAESETVHCLVATPALPGCWWLPHRDSAGTSIGAVPAGADASPDGDWPPYANGAPTTVPVIVVAVIGRDNRSEETDRAETQGKVARPEAIVR